ITMIPIVFVLTWEPGILVTMDIPLSVITITIASIIVGTGVDYGVHITQRVREGLRQGLDKKEAVEEAIEKTGLSLVEAALTTVAGLLSVYFVNVPGLQEFMKVVISMIILSLISAVFILPVFYKIKSVK
ncbi:MAG TPA: MFS transporter, partial [Thermoplasmatales archaeon]|nr:MFS transporter [Thermoplasmatales archaeon]